MSRSDIEKIEDRRPFYLYVDEFQNFATESFAVILSEARKYGLRLTVANQYVSQMPEEVRDAVFGNVGSIISFRIGADDAQYLAKYFEPVFEPSDLVNLDKQNIYVSMSIDGQTSQPFSAKTLNMPAPRDDLTQEIIANSRRNYSKNRTEVEALINEWAGHTNSSDNNQTKTDKKTDNPPANNPDDNQKRPTLHGVEPKRYSELIKSKSKSTNNRPKQDKYK
jgi:hypothetical protein